MNPNVTNKDTAFVSFVSFVANLRRTGAVVLKRELRRSHDLPKNLATPDLAYFGSVAFPLHALPLL
jgi:hypothetical protein